MISLPTNVLYYTHCYRPSQRFSPGYADQDDENDEDGDDGEAVRHGHSGGDQQSGAHMVLEVLDKLTWCFTSSG